MDTDAETLKGDPPELVVITGDWHVNDTMGLCPPVFQREKLAEYRPGPAVQGIYQDWLCFWSLMWRKKQQCGARCIVIDNGDLGDINSHEKTQLISNDEPDILKAMVDVSSPIRDVADVEVVIRGTAAHTGGNGKLEEYYARIVGAERDAENGHNSWFTFEAEFGGVAFDITHHPPTATTLPNKINQAAARGAERVALRYIREGRKPPDVAIWGHRHVYGHGSELGTRGFYVPSWKYTGAFGLRIGMGAHIEPAGGLWFLCQGGKILDWDYELFQPRRQRRWRYTR